MNLKQLLNKNSIINSAIWYTVGSFVLKGVNFFTVPIFTSLLTTTEIGKVNIYSTWGAMGAILIGIGIDGTIGSAKANLEEEEYKEYLSSVLFFATMTFIIIFAMSFIFKGKLANLMGIDKNLIFILVVQSFFSFVISFVSAKFTFDRNHKAYLSVSFLSTILNIVISISMILSMSSNKHLGRIYGWAISTIVVGLVLYFKIILEGKKLVSLKYWKFCLPIALPLIFHNLSHLLLNQADVIMLQKVTTDSIVGIYTTIYMMGSILNIIQIAINGAWVPWYYEVLKKGDKKELKQKSGQYIIVFTLLTIMFILGVPEVIKIFISNKAYWASIPLVYIVIVGYYFVYLYTFPANYQFYMKETKFIAVGTITSALVNIAINWMLIPYMGMYGAALATLIAYVVLFSMHFLIVKYKFKHQDFPFKYNLLGIGIVLITWLVSYILLDYFIIRWGIIILLLGLSGMVIVKEIKKIS